MPLKEIKDMNGFKYEIVVATTLETYNLFHYDMNSSKKWSRKCVHCNMTLFLRWFLIRLQRQW